MHLIGSKRWFIKTAAVSFFSGTVILTGSGYFMNQDNLAPGSLMTVYGESVDRDARTEGDAEESDKNAGSIEAMSETQQNAKSSSEQTETETEQEADPVEINWWICPSGGFSDEENVQSLVDLYEEANPGVDVSFRILDEEGGDEEILSVLGTQEAPDVVLAAPEKIVTQWGGEGYMADLAELWDEKAQDEFRTEMKETAQNRGGVWYAVPLYRDIYTMAINYDMFEKAGALQYLNEEAHSWKDNGFIDAVLRIHDYLEQGGAESSVAGRVYCKDETGQREFMSFVNNFFNSCVVDDLRSTYQVSKGSIRDVFGTLRRLKGKGIEFNDDMDGNDENEAFLNGEVFLTFNWDAAKQEAAQEDAGFQIYPMMYPNSKNLPVLTGTIRSLGIVETGDEEKKNAAFSFVGFLMNDETAYKEAVRIADCFPARRKINGKWLSNLYQGNEVMELYATFNEYYGDYYPMMELFDQFEKEWVVMMQKISAGKGIKSITKKVDEKLDSQLAKQYNITEIDTGEGE